MTTDDMSMERERAYDLYHHVTSSDTVLARMLMGGATVTAGGVERAYRRGDYELYFPTTGVRSYAWREDFEREWKFVRLSVAVPAATPSPTAAGPTRSADL